MYCQLIIYLLKIYINPIIANSMSHLQSVIIIPVVTKVSGEGGRYSVRYLYIFNVI